jgi:uncharacterized protein YdiU (UPF0061 family)
MPTSPSYRPAPRFGELAADFADVVVAAEFPKRVLRFRNQRWADRVGLGSLTPEEWESHFAKFAPLPGNLASPLALRYHGHQFDVYNPALGDGRGFLFAQLRDAVDGRLLDLGTKGSGRTPYSRGGDGRLTLKGGVREVLATEMLEALGVYTSKSFSLFETGEALFRGDEPSPTRSSVLVRLSHSHVRIGTFQRLRHLGDDDGLRRLLDYSVESFYPELASEADVPAAFVRAIASKSARLCAAWLVAGFVHGVLNSDNMTVTGESFDYGPYRFLPHYDPSFTAAYFDHSGLYAFGRQPRAVFHNLERLVESLAPLGHGDSLAHALDDFAAVLSTRRAELLLARLGVMPTGREQDQWLAALCWQALGATRIPYDRFFFDWHGGSAGVARTEASPFAEVYRSAAFAELSADLSQRRPTSSESADLPYFRGAGPCTLVIDEVEEIWRAIDQHDDWGPFDRKIAAIRMLGEIPR